MTRKDYELIAGVMRDQRSMAIGGFLSPDPRSTVAQVAEAFADRLASANPNFDRAKFLRACGV